MSAPNRRRTQTADIPPCPAVVATEQQQEQEEEQEHLAFAVSPAGLASPFSVVPGVLPPCLSPWVVWSTVGAAWEAVVAV